MNVNEMPGESVEMFSSAEPVSSLATGFYRRTGKKTFDVVASALGLLPLMPVFLLVSALVKMTSAGPVFYLQERVGENKRRFRIIKFRSMAGPEDVGPEITAAGDTRVTRLGKILRRLKIDELPQLWNVLNGEMSLVGPRPELPRYVAGYTQAQEQVLSVPPGITGPASIAYQREEELLPRDSDLESFYRERVLPHKLALDLEYLEKISFASDLGLIAQTIRSLFSLGPAVKGQ
jgi:lipopolysaccharide/colanic/teichoic acid biosynthesis glycosyltransferase